jgi:hypothetical protein
MKPSRMGTWQERALAMRARSRFLAMLGMTARKATTKAKAKAGAKAGAKTKAE